AFKTTGKYNCLAFNRRTDRRANFLIKGANFSKQRCQSFTIMRLIIKIYDGLGDNRSDPLDRGKLLPGFITLVCTITLHRSARLKGRAFKSRIGTISSGKTFGINFTHMTNSQSKEKTAQADFTSTINRLIKVAHRGSAKALNIFKLSKRARLSLLQCKNIGWRFNPQILIIGMKKELNLLFPQPFNVKSIARNKVANTLNRLCRTGQPTGAAINRFAFLAHGMAITDRTLMRKDERHCILRPLLHHHLNDLRNNISSTLHDDRIADAILTPFTDWFTLNTNPFYVIFIMQSGVGNHHATHSYRCEARHRR